MPVKSARGRELGSGAVDDELDRVRDQQLADHDQQDEQRDRAICATARARRRRSAIATTMTVGGIAEVRDRLEHVVREGPSRAASAHRSTARSTFTSPDVPPDHPDEQTDRGARHHDADQGNGEDETGRRSRDPVRERRKLLGPGPAPKLRPDRLATHCRRVRLGPVAHHEEGSEARGDAHDARQRAAPPCRNPLSGTMIGGFPERRSVGNTTPDGGDPLLRTGPSLAACPIDSRGDRGRGARSWPALAVGVTGYVVMTTILVRSGSF